MRAFPADRDVRLLLASAVALAASLALSLSVALRETPYPVPSSVQLEGTLATAVGCAASGPCPTLQMTPGPIAPGWLDGLSALQRRYLAPQTPPIFTLTVDLPAGHHAYRARATGAGGETVSGAGGWLDGAPFTLDLLAPRRVTFFYSPLTRWVADDVKHPITVATGTFQQALGCAQDWDPGCLQTWMQDPEGDGFYSLSTRLLPVGHHEVQPGPAHRDAPMPERTPFRVLRPAEEVRFVWHPDWPKVVVEFPERSPKAEAEAIARELAEESTP